MSDEQLAMLGPKTMRYGQGRGGIPEVTAVDVAAALGFSNNKFATEMYLIVRGPSVRNVGRADELLGCEQFAEWRKRADRMVNAQLAVAEAAQSAIITRPFMQHRAKMMLEGAKAAMWPQLDNYGPYHRIRLAVFAELRSPRICRVCKGRKHVVIEDKVIECTRCAATGVQAISDRQRADAIDESLTTYLRTWRKVYEWTYNLVANAVSDGKKEFEKAMAA